MRRFSSGEAQYASFTGRIPPGNTSAMDEPLNTSDSYKLDPEELFSGSLFDLALSKLGRKNAHFSLRRRGKMRVEPLKDRNQLFDPDSGFSKDVRVTAHEGASDRYAVQVSGRNLSVQQVNA